MAMSLIVCLCLPTCGWAVAAPAEQPTDVDEEAILARSLVSIGDTARLQHALAKARRGQPVVVGVIGGSITQGASASTEEGRYGNRVAEWWRTRFPGTRVTFINAGVGATGSDTGAHRAQAHLLDHRPDFVVAEYAVNDPNTEFAAETLEGLTRQILTQPSQPALMLLFTMNNAGANAQEWHSKVGEHYGLPMVSFRDALWPEIRDGRMKWEDIEADAVHPNDRGHAYCAQFICRVLDTVMAGLPDDADLPPVPPVPAPLISDVFQHATFYNFDLLTPVVCEGFEAHEAWPFGTGWQAEAAGSRIEFELEGSAISVSFFRIKGAMGQAEAQVDDREPVRLEAWFDQDWGGYSAFQLIARDLGPGKHRLRIRVLDEKAPASEGNRFLIHAIMAAGLR
ncbi:MAG TPA: SGNH/GDSL hydrolase family protein [Armatimonadota bacterium]|nr:SGNH/GDSL hydrolase family protein [Armatimonadota bacterium]